MSDGEVFNLSLAEIGRGDAAIAHELRLELGPKLNEIAAIMDRARANGLTVTFNIGADPHGRHRVVDIGIVRPL